MEGKRFADYVTKHLGSIGKADDGQDQQNDQQAADNVLSTYTSPTFTDELASLLQDFIIAVYADAGTETEKQIADLIPGFEVDQSFHSLADAYAQQRTAELVTNLPDSTKTMLRDDLAALMNAGASPADIAKELQADYAFSEQRAYTIARTETGFAWNDGALSMYGTAMEKVYVYDGDHDPECREADGQVWTIEYAKAHLLEHPNCVRSFGPCLEDVEPDRTIEDDGE